MKFIEDTREQDIVQALLTGQSKITIDRVEVFLKPLKIDTSYRKELAAKKEAKEIIKLLDS